MDTKFSVALHIMMYISETKKIATSEVLAESVNTNSSHIRKIVALLKNANLISSKQGKSGFTLGMEAKDISLADIYKALYGNKTILNIHAEPNLNCPVGYNVKEVIQPIFNKADEIFIKELEKYTLLELIKKLYVIGEKNNESSTTHKIQ